MCRKTNSSSAPNCMLSIQDRRQNCLCQTASADSSSSARPRVLLPEKKKKQKAKKEQNLHHFYQLQALTWPSSLGLLRSSRSLLGDERKLYIGRKMRWGKRSCRQKPELQQCGHCFHTWTPILFATCKIK